MKTVDYNGKCGTCKMFERDGDRRSGWCHGNPYDVERVVCDLEHPFQVVTMSKIRCTRYCRVEEEK